MRLLKALSIAPALVFVALATAEPATLRTAPFNGIGVLSGLAYCAVTNASASNGVASATLYDVHGVPLASFSARPVNAHSTEITDTVNLSTHVVTHCECTVPTTTTWRCTVLWGSADGSIGTTTP